MDINQAIDLVKEQLTKARFDHTLRVLELSEILAERFHAPAEKVKLAAVFHDYAKNWSKEKLEQYILENKLPKELLQYHKELWHGPAAASVLNLEYHIEDKDILGAVCYHTTGKENMNQVEMIVYLADYMEPGRDFPGLEEVRKASETDLVYACWLVSRNTLEHLLNRSALIHPDSLRAYNCFTRQIKSED